MPRTFLCIVALVAGSILFTAPAAARDWQLYNAPDGSFSVMLPTVPAVSDGGRTAVSRTNKRSVYIVKYLVLKAPEESMHNKLFAVSRNALSGDVTYLDVKSHQVLGHPAQDIHFRFKKSGDISWDRMIIVNDRFYQLAFTTTKDSKATPTRFWNSFTLNR